MNKLNSDSELLGAFGLYQVAELQELMYHFLGQFLPCVFGLMQAIFEQSNPLKRVFLPFLFGGAGQGLELGLEDPVVRSQAGLLCLRRQLLVLDRVFHLASR